MNLHNYFYGLFLCLSPLTVTAQSSSSFSVVGQVRDRADKPVEFATVLLLRSSDSSMVTGSVSDAAGNYSFELKQAGTFRVLGQQIGYQKIYTTIFTLTPDRPRYEAGPLRLPEAIQTLKTVTVKANKSFIEQLPGKTVINVENSLVAAGGTALDVLERAPGVVVDAQNERISLKGRDGTLVMIDGKPTYLSAQEVVNLLRNTPSSSIASIELVTNPSAKYDATGNAGIINIQLKHGSRTGGTNGNITVGSGYGSFPKATTGLTVNHRTRGLNLFSNYTFDYRESYGSVDALRAFGNPLPTDPSQRDSLTTVRNLSYRTSTARNHAFNAGGNYTLGKRTTVGLSINGLLSNNSTQIDNMNAVKDAENKRQKRVTLLNASTRSTQRLSTSANFRHAFDTLGRELTIDADISRVVIDPQDNMETRYYDALDRETQPSLIQRNLPPSTVTIRAAKADYVHPLTKQTRLEAGGKISYVTSDNDLRFETLTESGYVADPTRTNHFLFDETITAGYLNGTHHWNKWSVQGGLRAEHTHSVGNSITLRKLVDRRYLNLFPSVFITYMAGPDHQWQASFSRRIDRPNYQDINPFIYIMDPYTFREGNPFLRPQYTSTVKVGYTNKGEKSVSLSYNHTTDVITGVNEQVGQVLRVTTVNLAALTNVNLNASMPVKPTAWWTIQPSVDVFWNVYNAEYAGQRLDYRQTSANVTLNQRFILPHGLTAELSGFYNSPLLYGQLHLKGIGQVSAGVQHHLWKKTATLRLNVSDLFQTARSAGRINYGPTNLTFTNRWESRVVRLTFTWNFGSQKLRTMLPRRSGVEDEQGRVGGI